MIFHHVVHLDVGSGTQHRLASVCHSWWKIILTTPQLWTSVSCYNSHSVREWKRALRLSGQLGLHVVVSFGALDGESRKATLNQLLSEIHNHRWKSLKIDDSLPGTDVWDTVHGVLNGGSNLESLAVDLNTYSTKVAWTLPTLPKLEHLQTRHAFFILPSDGSTTLGLRRLSVTSVVMDDSGLESLMEFLGCCSALEALYLDSIKWTPGSLNTRPRIIDLTKVRTVLLNADSGILWILLQSICVGGSLDNVIINETGFPLTEIRVIVEVFCTATSLIVSAFQNLPPPAPPRVLFQLGGGHQVTVSSYPSTPGASSRFVTFPSPDLFALNGGLRLFDFDGAPSIRLELGLFMYSEDTQPEPQLLLSYPSATEVVLQSTDQSFHHWLHFLSNPWTRSAGVAEWAVPMMTRLEVYDLTDWKPLLVDLVRSRRDARRTCDSRLAVPEVYDSYGRKLHMGSIFEEE